MTKGRSGPAQIAALTRPALTLGMALSITACNSAGELQHAPGIVPSAKHSSLVNSLGDSGATPATTISVDIRQYMAAIIAQKNGTQLSGEMLCDIRTSKSNDCNTSLTDTAGEARLYGSKGSGIDYVAITSWSHPSLNGDSSPQYIGVIRNWTGPASGNILRCFSTPHHICASPPDSSFMPEAVPYLIPSLPRVGNGALADATNPVDGSPLKPIVGSMVTTPKASTGDYWNFGVHDYNWPYGCTQTYDFEGTSQVRIVYVNNVHFHGTIGTSDAIVIDGYSGASSSSDHVERAIYVQGLGRVGFGVAFYDPSDGLYDNTPHYAHTHSNVETIDPNNFNFQGEQCNQGTAITLWPSTLHITGAAGFQP